MKKYSLIVTILLLLSLFNFYCKKNYQNNSLRQVISIDSLYSLNNIKFTRRLSKLDGTIICISHFTDNQIVSIEIKNSQLFEKFRDSLNFQSNRLIGVQIFGYKCAGCHDFRPNKVIKLVQKPNEFNLFLTNSSHKKYFNDTLNLDEIHFIKEYLNSLPIDN